MKSLALPPSEHLRLASLHRLNLLDTPREERFDRITRLVQYMFHVPIALINLVDAERVWFKSCVGVEGSEASRDVVFCAHTILNGEPLIILNTSADERFAEHPLVTGELAIRFYAGVPLKSPDGQLVGTLCLMDVQPREFSTADRAAFVDVAHWAEQELASIELKQALQDRHNAEVALLQERQHLRQLIDAAPLAIAMFDTQMRYVAHSTTWLTSLGRVEQNMLGTSLYESMPDTIERWKPYHLRALKGETISKAEEAVPRSDGTVDYMRWVITPWFSSPGVIGGIVIVSDQVNELVYARELALQAAQTKSNFLATMSHEIRTPIAAITGMTELLLLTELSTQQREFAHTVQKSANNLLTIINDILDFSKLEAGKFALHIEEFDPHALTDDLIKLLEIQARKQGITLQAHVSHDVPSRVRGASDRLRQVLLNLINNAIKFTAEGGVNVHVSIETRTSSHVTLRFAVRDTGIGMSKQTRERIFKPFTQADSSTSRKYGGTGLGLAIAKQLVELMGGSIGVASVEGQGSNFWVVVPLEYVTGKRPELAVAPSTMPLLASHLNILVAEDTPVNQRLILLQLQQLGFSADAVPNGREAIKAVSNGKYDLVLMDCQMGDMDGFAATRAIRAAEALDGGHIPIVAMTANVMEGTRDACLAAGMDDYLPKPVTIAALGKLLERWIPADDIPAATMASDQPVGNTAGLGQHALLDPTMLAELRRLSSTDEPNLLSEIIDLFLTQAPPLFHDLRKAIAAHHTDAVYRYAHQLKGMSGNFGALHLIELCQSLEMQGRSGQLIQANDILEQIEVEFARVEQALLHEKS